MTLIQRRDFGRATSLTSQLIATLPTAIIILFLVTFFTNRFLEDLARELNNSEQGPWVAQVGQFLLSLTEGFAVLLVGGFFLLRQRTPMSWHDFWHKYLGPITAESLRALSKVLLWSLALIIPGFIVYCRLSIVPLVVFFDPTYATRPDAVARSLELTQKCWVRMTLFIVGLTVFDGIFELLPNLLHVDDMLPRMFFDLSGFLFSLFSFMLLYVVFERLLANEGK